jgi:hypothetical protein
MRDCGGGVWEKSQARTPEQGQTVQMPALGQGGWGEGGMAGHGMGCTGRGRSRGPRYLLGSGEGMVEAGHVSHDGFLIGPGSSNNVCQERCVVKASW